MTEYGITKLTDLALGVFEDELACWQRHGTDQRETTKLVRHPIPLFGSDSNEADQAIVPDPQVDSFLTRAAMERAVRAVLKEVLI